MFSDSQRTWWPTEHEQARLNRMQQDRGHYYNCRHYKKTAERSLYCEKYGHIKKTCEGCMTCPNCDGLMYTYRMKLDLKKELNKTRSYITHSKSCILCGAYIDEHYVMENQDKKESSKKNQCQVDGCMHTAYEEHTYEEESEGRKIVFIICLTHKRRMKTWRLHPDKGIDQKPIMVVAGRLYDNPNYEKKQEKRKT